MEIQFDFNIGDLMMLKHWKDEVAIIHAAEKQARINGAKEIHGMIKVWKVIERIYEECSGGVQYHYLIKPALGLIGGAAVRLNQIELVPFNIVEYLDELYPHHR